MKTTLLFSTILLASITACYKDEAVLNEIPQDPLTKAQDYLSGNDRVKMKRHKITENRAMQIAQEAKGLFADENERVIRSRSIGTTLVPLVVTKQNRSRSAGGIDTLMYIVNYSNEAGFVFVSNDDRDGEILMYSGNGNFAMQDTAGNPGLKLHVEMMIAYQEHKLSEMKAAEARGEEYIGSLISEEVSDEEMPNILSSTRGATGIPGMPGIPGGLPGHTCNVTGQHGMPGAPVRKDICAPSNYDSKGWEGSLKAITLAKNKYPNQKCFGIPTSPPTINFMTGGEHGFIGDGGVVSNCESAPYCRPPLWNYSEYYHFYGAKMSMHLKTTINENNKIAPLLTTCWDQDAPLNHGANAAGCGPIAMAQLMVYHNMPKAYGSKIFGGTINTEIDKLRNLRTNADIAASPYKLEAWQFLEEIRDRLNVTYNSSGTTSTNAGSKMGNIMRIFESFGYSTGYGEQQWDYYRDQNFWRVVESIRNGQPVYVRGNEKGGENGHQWILDGYKVVVNNYYYADYYFDEYGKFNAENRHIDSSLKEYIHANMGWGDDDLVWVVQGIYVFAEHNYNNEMFYLAGIKPH